MIHPMCYMLTLPRAELNPLGVTNKVTPLCLWE